MMNQQTISYGLVPPQSANNHDTHILPIIKMVPLKGSFLTCGRDGTLVKHFYTSVSEGYQKRIRMQIHSDWVSDVARLDDETFLTVSHDFSVSLVSLTCYADSRNKVILGCHDDYVKCVTLLPAGDTNGSNREQSAILFATAGLDKKVKFWRLQGISATVMFEYDNTQPHDTGSVYALCALSGELVIIGDNNGDLKIISAISGELVHVLHGAHVSNVRLVQILEDGETLITTSSDGTVKLWDIQSLSNGNLETALVNELKWACAVWSIASRSVDEFIVGDVQGKLTSLRRNNSSWREMEQRHLYSHPTASGILAIMFNNNGHLWFSSCTSSNLYFLPLSVDSTLKYIEGGSALVKSCLLTNRRNVITLNTVGEVQKWDIVSCELLDTFKPDDGTFDELVKKHNTKEILPHWCSVSIKTGKLFVKFSNRFTATEVYGTALKQYKIINGVEINEDQRYNLGRLAINSILDEFIRYETRIDKLIRMEVASCKKSFLPVTPTIGAKDINSTAGTGAHDILPSSSGKERNRVSSLLKNPPPSQGGLANPPSRNVTPVSEQSTMFMNESLNSASKPANDAPVQLIMPKPITAPHLPYSSSNRSESPVKTPVTAPEAGSKQCNDADQLLPWRLHKQSNASGLIYHGSTDSSQNLEHTHLVSQDLISSSPSKNPAQMNSPASASGQGCADTLPAGVESMYDYLRSIKNAYYQQVASKYSAFKKFGRKVPETQFVRDADAPIIEIKNGCILLVNYWRAGSCGDTVLFSTFLPAPRYDWSFDDYNPSKDDAEKSTVGMKLDYLHRVQLFQTLEQSLPYWFAKLLFKEEMIVRNYPKLNFILSAWAGVGNSDVANMKEEKNRLYPHSPFHKKAVDFQQPLPNIVENNIRLNAPDMIKVKKIKQFVVDRFESKTQEMKNRESASEWLELLCKGSVLDNEMTLGAIKALYWKSSNDVVLEYRRKSQSKP